MSLVRKKGYDAITVADICEAAQIRRSTFYSHYAGKDDLKRRGLEHLRKSLFEHQKKALVTSDHIGERRLAFSLPMFEHARDHIDAYRALVGTRGGKVALDTIRKILADLFREELTAKAGEQSANAMPRELAVQIVLGVYMTVLTWWLDGGARLPPDQVDAMFRRLVTKGLFFDMRPTAR
jgi:AcrR family transcriptional regulator